MQTKEKIAERIAKKEERLARLVADKLNTPMESRKEVYEVAILAIEGEILELKWCLL